MIRSARLIATLPFVFVAWCVAPAPAVAQESPTDDAASATAGETFTVQGVTETVDEIMARDARLPHGALVIREKQDHERGDPKRDNPDAPAVSQWPPPSAETEGDIPALLRPTEPRLPQTVGTNFLAIQVSEAGFIPPDSMGAVGPSQILAVANGRIKLFDRNGVLVPGGINTTTDNFFTSVGGVTNGTSDPHIRYDRLSRRWFVVMIDLAACPNGVLMAVSSGPVITNTSSFTFFRFVGEANHFTDYPTLGVDRNALYIGGDMFPDTGPCTAGRNTTVWVVNKASLIAGAPVVTAFRNLVPAGAQTGMLTPQGVDNDDPASTQGYFVAVDFFDFSELVIKRVSNPGGTPANPPTPTLSADITLVVPITRYPIFGQVQPGPFTLDAIDDRLFSAAVRRNKISGITSLWTAHNIQVSNTGVGSTTGGRNGSRWYEIVNLATTPSLRQVGTLFDPAPTANQPFGYWMPSTTISGQGHMAIASSRASANAGNGGFASVAAAGRLRLDVLGTTQGPTPVQLSTFSYNVQGANQQRWGDYSQTVVDPNDDQTMWTFQEWANGTASWAVQVTRLVAPPPAVPTTATPASVFQGMPSINVTIDGPAAASAAEFFDPGPDTGGPGYPNHLTASVTGGVTVNSAVFVNTNRVTLNISTVGAPIGAKIVRVTNPDGQNREGQILTVIGCPTITVNPATVPSGTIGTGYSQTFTQTGGAAPVTFGLAGTLPAGVTFNAGTATISGTPTQIGSFNFTVTATDTNNCTGNRGYTLDIGCQTITVSPASIPAGTAGSPYSQTFTQTGGNGTVTWSVTGTLPTGISLNPATGELSGTPTQTGSFPITITATDSNGCTGVRNVTLVIDCQTITVDPATIPNGTAGTPYSQAFTQTGGIGTITWSVTGTLPTGLSLDSSTGVLSGTPTQTGSFPITITATDANGCFGSRSYTLGIDCPTITVDPATIPNGTAGSPYSQTFTQTGGLAPITWSVTGTLPSGLTLDTATGELSGTPTQTGSFPITITATDVNGCFGSRSYTLVIDCPTITVDPATIPNGTAGSPYSHTFTQTGGIGTITWSVTGTLPTGLTLDTATGELSGTPTQTGSFPITITATDVNGCFGSRGYTLVIDCQAITVNPATLPDGTANVPYSQTFTQTGGIGTITWSANSSMPPGLTLDSSTGVLSGTPTLPGTYNFTIRADDANGCRGERIYNLVIGCPTITVNPATIPAATAGSPYSQTFTQTGGNGAAMWSLTGTLPTGLTFNTATGVLSGTPTQLGSFPITVGVLDNNACPGSRSYTLVVNAAGPFVATALNVDEAGNRVFEAGETAVVAPSWRNDTGAPQPLTGAATLFTGPGTSTYTITDTAANYGASVAAGGTASCSSATGDCYGFNITVPGTRPSVHWDSTFRETLSSADARTWTLHVGDSFTDVPRSNLFYRFVETLLHKAITGGCAGTTYCPGASTLREQMAVFVLVAKEGPGYQPPACTTPIFNDVPASNQYCKFIEELSRRGVVSGCGAGNYCPQAAVTRDQMAVFVLRTLDPTLNPPACTTPMFNDVPASSTFCRWIEELARRGVVTGCGGGNYCPASPVTREQVGVFITVTFGLTLYGL